MRSKISELEYYACYYGGNKTLGEIIAELKRKTPYKCPQCNGSGTTTRCIPGELGYTEDRFIPETCSLCDGVGYTEKSTYQEWFKMDGK